MRLKSLILISHCRLACNCLGSRRLPARLQPRCEDGGTIWGRVWLRFARLHSWIMAFSTVKIEVNWLNRQVFCFFFPLGGDWGLPHLPAYSENAATPKALLNNHRCHVAAWMSAPLHLVAFFKFHIQDWGDNSSCLHTVELIYTSTLKAHDSYLAPSQCPRYTHPSWPMQILTDYQRYAWRWTRGSGF